MNKNGMGIDGLTWTEISHWLSETELELSIWEKLTIKALSDNYASEYMCGSDRDRPAPYSTLPEGFDRSGMSKQVVSVMQGLMARQPAPKAAKK